MPKKRRKKSTLPFVQMHEYLMRTPAWKHLSPPAKALYPQIKRRFNGQNNGSIVFSVREAAEALGRSKSSAARYLKQLEDHGFIAREKAYTFDQKRLAVEWRLTELRNDISGELPTKEFIRWQMDTSLSLNEKQKPVPYVNSIVPKSGLKTTSPAGNKLNSATSGTVGTSLTSSQSRQRDTYTSTPGGRLPNKAAADDRQKEIDRSTMEGLKRSRPFVVPAKELLPPAGWQESHSMNSDAAASGEVNDPLVRAILESFPGARLVSTPSSFSRTVRRGTVSKGTFINEAAPARDVYDVVPERWEQQFWS